MKDERAFERFILRSDHPKALEYGLQLAAYQDSLLYGTATKADLESLRANLRTLYDELKDQVPQDF